MSKDTKLNIEHVQVEDIFPRDVNTNKMTEKQFDFLVKYMEKAGYVQPIIVVKNDEGTYTIVDGEHRWLAAKENGITSIDVVVTDLTLRDQDVMSINMNMIRGELQPDKFGDVLRRIAETDDAAMVDELSNLIAMEKNEIAAYLKLTETAGQEEEVQEPEPPAFLTYKFKVSTEDEEFFAECFDQVRRRFPNVREDGDILYNLCYYFMSREVSE